MASRPRLLSLDVFRGLAVAAMITVNHQGNWGAVYAPLHHAVWNGWTPADLIFPAFIFAVGISAELSITARLAAGTARADLVRQVVRRGAVIFLLGLFLNWFPGLDPSDLMGPDPSSLGEAVSDRLSELRILGVLQRIGLVYAMGGTLVALSSWRVQAACLIGILVLYAAALLVMGPDFPGAVDRSIFDWGAWGNHLWGNTRIYDPEGVVSTFAALGTMILGLLTGRWVQAEANALRRTIFVALAGAVLTAAGLLLDPWLPINKSLWSSTFVLLSGGLCGLVLAAIMAWLDFKGGSHWGAAPLLVFGVNPLTAYFGSELMANILSTGGLSDGVYGAALASWLPPKLASLAFALCYVTVWYFILRALHRRGIVLRIR